MSDVLILTIGSAGDVHPFIGIGAALAAKGHRVRLITSPYFAGPVAAAGLELIPLGEAQDFADALKNPDVWHNRRGVRLIFNVVLTGLRQTYDAVAGNASADTVVVASSLGFGARIAQDRLGFKMATVHLAPSQFRSSIAPPRLPGLWMPSWLPLRVRRGIWAGGDKYVLDPILAPRINAFRGEVGLSPVRGILNQWWNSPDRVIGLFPAWFCPPQADWPSQAVLTGFARYDESASRPADRDLDAFLDVGDPPIAFTPGSAMSHGHAFFKTAVEICRRLGRRGLLLTRHAGHLPDVIPPGVRVVEYAPFSRVFPRCAAVVHHGGIGTTAQALAAGVPQLVTPFAHDQHDNAMRVTKLDVGRTVAARRFGAKSAGLLAESIELCGAAAKRAAQKFDGDDAVGRTCRSIESLDKASHLSST